MMDICLFVYAIKLHQHQKMTKQQKIEAAMKRIAELKLLIKLWSKDEI